MIDEERARLELIEVCQRLYAKGWVANHDGNASVRVGPDRIVTTPTAVSKGDVRPEQLIVVDLSGKKLEGTRKPFSELALHLKIYRERPDAKAVVHAHPPTACGFAVAGIPVETVCMPEAVVSLGSHIPLTGFVLPFGDEGAAVLDGHLEDADAFLLANHGVLTLADDLWTAFYRLELVEQLARIQLVARQLGGASRLAEADVQTLLERRTKAGLGAVARRQALEKEKLGKPEAPGSSPSAPSFSLPEGMAASAWTGGAPSGPDASTVQALVQRVLGKLEADSSGSDRSKREGLEGLGVVSPCSGERRDAFFSDGKPVRAGSGTSEVGGRTATGPASAPMSPEALQQLLKAEVARVLGG